MKDIDMDLVPALAVHDWPKAANQLEFLDSEKAEQIKQKGFYVIAKDCTKGKSEVVVVVVLVVVLIVVIAAYILVVVVIYIYIYIYTR